MKKVYLFLADGFEETEALTPVDVLRRAGVDVVTVSVTGRKNVTGSHGITILADTLLDDEKDLTGGDMLLLPGGPGHKELAENVKLKELIMEYDREQKLLAAICAAPSIYGRLGLLKGMEATCFPGFEDYMKDAVLSRKPVVRDGRYITARGMGVSLLFSLELVKALVNEDTAEKLAAGLQCILN